MGYKRRIMAGIKLLIIISGHLCQIVNCFWSSLNTSKGKQSKFREECINSLYNWLVNEEKSFATTSNCGKFLTALATIFAWKHTKRTRLIVDPNGNNAKDWIIRSQASYCRKKVQRLNEVGDPRSLRYSPASEKSARIRPGWPCLLQLSNLKQYTIYHSYSKIEIRKLKYNHTNTV